jgi:hypothetical protein
MARSKGYGLVVYASAAAIPGAREGMILCPLARPKTATLSKIVLVCALFFKATPCLLTSYVKLLSFCSAL